MKGVNNNISKSPLEMPNTKVEIHADHLVRILFVRVCRATIIKTHNRVICKMIDTTKNKLFSKISQTLIGWTCGDSDNNGHTVGVYDLKIHY